MTPADRRGGRTGRREFDCQPLPKLPESRVNAAGLAAGTRPGPEWGMATMTIAPRRFGACALLAAWVLAPAAIAHAQTAADKPAPAPAAATWTSDCPEDETGKVRLCMLKQDVFLRNTGQRLLSVVIEKRGTKPDHAIRLALPLGLYIPARVVMRVDRSGGSMKLGILTCDHGGCFTGGRVTRRFLRRMMRGRKLLVTFQTAARKEVTVPVTLDGFTARYRAAKLK